MYNLINYSHSVQYYATTYCFYVAAESKNGAVTRVETKMVVTRGSEGRRHWEQWAKATFLIPARGSSGSFLNLYWLPDWPFCCLIVFDTGAYLQSIPMATTVGF